MKIFLVSAILGFSLGALADYPDWRDGYPRGRDRIINVSVRGQSYYPDQLTADGICRLNGHRRAVGFTQWRQAGNRIQGYRSFDGRPNFQVETWGGGMAIDNVGCVGGYYEPVTLSVRGQGYYPDQFTAHAICRFNGYERTTGFTQWRQAGNRIQGLRSFDGRPYFQTDTWGGGMAIDLVNCQ